MTAAQKLVANYLILLREMRENLTSVNDWQDEEKSQLRHAFNEACDRMDVLASKLADV